MATKTINQLQKELDTAIYWHNQAHSNWHAIDQAQAIDRTYKAFKAAQFAVRESLGKPTDDAAYDVPAVDRTTDEYARECAREDRMHRGMELFGGTFA